MTTRNSQKIDEIAKYFRAGMEDGPDPIIRAMPMILGRIQELERALVPFARAGLKDNEGKPLIQVYHKDCKTAFETLSVGPAEAISDAVLYPAQ